MINFESEQNGSVYIVSVSLSPDEVVYLGVLFSVLGEDWWDWKPNRQNNCSVGTARSIGSWNLDAAKRQIVRAVREKLLA